MTKRNPLPTYERVRELFDYDPDTGILRWKVKRAQMDVGSVAGAKRGDSGHLQVSIDRKLYRVHLIIWLWMTGKEPEKFIDHKDTVKFHNNWDNLREATKSQNQANVRKPKNNKSGFKGVHWYKAGQCWCAQIGKDGNIYYLGYFDRAEDAYAAYCAKAVELYGEFARVG